MTAPATLYQQEMAKRGLTLPKHEPCIPSMADKRALRWGKLKMAPTGRDVRAAQVVRWYESGMTLLECAVMSQSVFGTKGYKSKASVASALKRYGVPRRTTGGGKTMKMLREENAALRAKLLAVGIAA